MGLQKLIGVIIPECDKWIMRRIYTSKRRYNLELPKSQVVVMEPSDSCAKDAIIYPKAFESYITDIKEESFRDNLKLNKNKWNKHYKQQIVIYQMDEINLIIDSSQSIPLSEFTEGYVYFVETDRAVQLFRSRKDAKEYGISNTKVLDTFSIVAIRTKHIGGPLFTAETYHPYQEEVAKRMENLPDAEIYDMLMEYMIYEVDIYSSKGQLMYGYWDNMATKCYMDFKNPEYIAEIRNHKFPFDMEYLDDSEIPIYKEEQ